MNKPNCPFCDAKPRRFSRQWLCGTFIDPDTNGDYTTGNECDKARLRKHIANVETGLRELEAFVREVWLHRGTPAALHDRAAQLLGEPSLAHGMHEAEKESEKEQW